MPDHQRKVFRTKKNEPSFKAGQSGNPCGRSPGVRSMAKLIDELVILSGGNCEFGCGLDCAGLKPLC